VTSNPNPDPGPLASNGRPALGLFLNMPMHETDGRLSARYPHLFDFFLALGGRTSATWLCVPLRRSAEPRAEYGPVELPERVHVAGLPHWSSAPMVVRRIHRIAPAAILMAARHIGRWDAVGAVVPSVVGTIFVTAARLRRRPVFLLVRGEKQRTVSWIMGRRLSTLPYIWALRAMEARVRAWIDAGVPAFVAGHELVERYRTPNARIYNLYPGVSRDFPLADSPRPSDDSEPRPLRLITVARLSREKGTDDLLRATAILRRAGAQVTLTVVGDGPERASLKGLASELGLDGKVEFTGFLSQGHELVAALDRADVFVLASHSEGLPHSVVEAMARALPVVATDVGGMPELLGDDAGVVVPSADPAALAGALAELADDPARRARLSASSLARARRFDPERVLDAFCARLADAYPALAGLQRR
jgi:glycosyltransferase involved in cell wall biosynthesis